MFEIAFKFLFKTVFRSSGSEKHILAIYNEESLISKISLNFSHFSNCVYYPVENRV